MVDGEQLNQLSCSECKKEKVIYNKEFVLCKNCYNKKHRDKTKQQECCKRWRDKNTNYFKEYYLKSKEKTNATTT